MSEGKGKGKCGEAKRSGGEREAMLVSESVDDVAEEGGVRVSGGVGREVIWCRRCRVGGAVEISGVGGEVAVADVVVV